MYHHDNAPAHAVRLTVNFLVVNRILVLDWPPLSSNMPPIELLIATWNLRVLLYTAVHYFVMVSRTSFADILMLNAKFQ